MRHLAIRARAGAARILPGLALIATSAVSAPAPRLTLDPPGLRQDTTWRSLIRAMPRQFTHERHENLPCRGCHGSGASHRVTIIRSPRECAACHHAPERQRSCETCHARDSIPVERVVPVAMTLQVASDPRVRNVTFRHAVHLRGDSALACATCHSAPVTMQRERACTSCHDSHHSGRATCSNCHPSPPPRAHGASVHLGCSGSACHAAAKAPSERRARAVCLFCHADRVSHEPGGDCATCHQIPAPSASAATPGSRAWRPGR